MFLYHRCEYLLQEKGQEFVNQIQARFPRLFEQVCEKISVIWLKVLMQCEGYHT